MKKQYKEWLRWISFLVVLFFLVLNVKHLWGNDRLNRIFEQSASQVANGTQTGKNMGEFIRQQLGSSSKVNQKLFQPLLTPTPMTPLSGNNDQAFNATILCPSSKNFLKVNISPSSTGDLTLYISYDKGFTGSLNTSLVVSGVSAICSNGFMRCNPGTMADCSSYVFYLDGNTLKYRMTGGSTGSGTGSGTRSGLSNCFCVNNACGGSNILISNLGYVLRAVGGMVVSAFLNNPSGSSYVVSNSKIDGMSIIFYGQDSSQCQFVDQGTNEGQNLKSYYQNPRELRPSGSAQLEIQRGDPRSLVSSIYGSTQLSSREVKTCVIKRVASGCSVVGRTEGDCNISSSCKVLEETWDGIPIIQGGISTKLNPLGSCVRDACGNLRCYEWTTKRVVYVCPIEKVFDPTIRYETVYRSTHWDRGSGMVYYSDLTLESDCRTECPEGYTYSFNSLKCEAQALCPSGYRFDPSVNVCVSEDTNTCQGEEAFQTNCNNCPSGYIYDNDLSTCVAELVCPSGGILVYDGGKLRCEVSLQEGQNCPSGSSYDDRLNICYTSPSCISGSFDSRIGKCVVDLSCPSGSSYDEAIGLCEAEEICPEETSYNDETRKCEGEPQCPSEAVWDASIAKCISCPSGYRYDNTLKVCVASNGTRITPTYSLPCSVGAIYNSGTGLCEGSPSCPSGLNFDSISNTCVATPSCPSRFSFDARVGVCVANPKCPSGFILNASLGLCVSSSLTSCPNGYVYDSNVEKCVFLLSCPGRGYWDNVLRKCVKESFCVSMISDNCKITPSCPEGGVWDQKLGKCVIETTCSSGGKWVRSGVKSFYLGVGPEGADCEFACKVKVVEPKTGVYLKESSTNYNLQYGTKSEKTEVSVSASYYYKPCIEVATNTWDCPVEDGEEVVDNCKCVNNFGQAASIMQAIRLAGQDFVCSSGRRH
jgi:hypothetical protein